MGNGSGREFYSESRPGSLICYRTGRRFAPSRAHWRQVFSVLSKQSRVAGSPQSAPLRRRVITATGRPGRCPRRTSRHRGQPTRPSSLHSVHLASPERIKTSRRPDHPNWRGSWPALLRNAPQPWHAPPRSAPHPWGDCVARGAGSRRECRARRSIRRRYHR